MFRKVSEMTNDEIQQEISELKLLRKSLTEVSVDACIEKTVDTSLLNKYGFTITPNGQFFNIKKHGILPAILEEMYADRKKFKRMSLDFEQKLQDVETQLKSDPHSHELQQKKQQLRSEVARYDTLQLAKKVCLNSAYGAIGNEYFRFFDIRVAEAVTISGQLSIKWIERALNKFLNEKSGTQDVDYIIAIDTDSVYITLEKIVTDAIGKSYDPANAIEFMNKFCEEQIKPYIDTSYEELKVYMNAYDNKMRMKRESLCDKALWTAKKRYILNVYDKEGVRYSTPKIKITGLEAVKSSTPSACRKNIKDAIGVIFNGNEDDVQSFIKAFRDKYESIPLNERAFPKGINGLAEYAHPVTIFAKGAPMHVKAALYYNKALEDYKLTNLYEKITDGDKIKYVPLKLPNPYKCKEFAFKDVLPPELKLEAYIDHEELFQKTFIAPLQIILQPIGWNAEKVSTLESFFE